MKRLRRAIAVFWIVAGLCLVGLLNWLYSDWQPVEHSADEPQVLESQLGKPAEYYVAPH